MIARRKVDQSKESATDAFEAPVLDVVAHELRGVARLDGLRLGHVPGLGRRALVEAVPGGTSTGLRAGRHAQ